MSNTSDIIIELPKPKNGETIGLNLAAAALGITRQAAFHMVRGGKFPVAHQLEGKRVRVKLSDLRKALGMKADQTSITVPVAIKKTRAANGQMSNPTFQLTSVSVEQTDHWAEVHAASCAHLDKGGRWGYKLGEGSWNFEADSKMEAAEIIGADFIAEGQSLEDDIFPHVRFAPCVKLPTHPVITSDTEDDLAPQPAKPARPVRQTSRKTSAAEQAAMDVINAKEAAAKTTTRTRKATPAKTARKTGANVVPIDVQTRAGRRAAAKAAK
jgi:hypothetical protein